MASVDTPTESRFLLSGVGWQDFLRWLKLLGDRHVRVTYDRGELELITLSPLHERCASLLGQFLEALTDAFQLPRLSLGSTTFKRKKLKRGLEPDRCYYLTNEPLMRSKDKIDLRHDPPPDLALEVEITRSALNRMGLYAKLGVPEVWRFDGQKLQVHQLGEGKYQACERSQYFPQVPLPELLRFLQMRTQVDETTLLRLFREWVQQQMAAGWLTFQ